MNRETSHFVSVHTATNRFEADLILDALEREEITAFLRSFEETPYDGLFVAQRGWGLIMVAEDAAAHAKQIIDSLIKELHTKPLYSDPSEIDSLLWENLREADPHEVCVNAQIRFDPKQDAYLIPFLDGKFLCMPHEQRMEVLRATPYEKLSFEFYLVMLHYLLEAQNHGLSDKWISEKDIPGGQLFFRGPHKFPFEPLIELFGSRPDVFRAACESLGGTPVKMGDAASRLWPFPRVPVIFVLWEGDDEFEPALHIRFNSTINLHLHTLDTIWALVNVICRNLRAAGKRIIAGSDKA